MERPKYLVPLCEVLRVEEDWRICQTSLDSVESESIGEEVPLD